MPGNPPTKPTKKGSLAIGQKAQFLASPCGQQRAPTDIAGQINDLINCYIITMSKFVTAYLGEMLLIFIVLMVMIISAYVLIKDT